MSQEMNALTKLIAAMIDPNVRTATAYLSPKYTMRFSRIHRHRRARSRTFALTLGTPNYEARQFIKRAKKAKEPFPVKRVQLRMWPPKPKAKAKRKGKRRG